jgi:hypothetical protein
MRLSEVLNCRIAGTCAKQRYSYLKREICSATIYGADTTRGI